MKRISLRLITAFLTCMIGVASAGFWFTYRNQSLTKPDELSCCGLSLDAIVPGNKPVGYYFAAGTFQADQARETGLSKWYARSLEEMHEPSFQSLVYSNIETYRFLWLRSFHPPVSIRVWKSGQDYCISVKRLDSIESFVDGKFTSSAKLAVNNTRPLKSDEWRGFLSFLEKARFWYLPTVDGKPIANDGAAWVLEGTKDKRYHVVDRQSPQSGDYREACVYLLELSELKVEEAKGELY